MVSASASRAPRNTNSRSNHSHSVKDIANGKGDGFEDYDSTKGLDSNSRVPLSQRATGSEAVEDEIDFLQRRLRRRATNTTLSPTDNSVKARKKNKREQKPRIPNIGNDSEDSPAPERSRASEEDGFLPRNAYNDLQTFPDYLYAPRRPFDFLGKWPVLIYILWMVVSHSIMAYSDQICEAVGPYCANKYYGSLIPFFCQLNWSDTPDGRGFEAIEKLAASQDGLVVVVYSVGQNHEMARDITRHKPALRDLRIRVAASNFNMKEKLTENLEGMIKYTDETSWAVSDLTAMLSRVIDKVIIIDKDAVNKLHAIHSTSNLPPTLREGACLIFNPLSAFMPARNNLTEQKLKDVLLATASKIAGELKPSIEQMREIHGLFKNIQNRLDSIGESTLEANMSNLELGALGALWKQFSRANEYAEHRSHEALLQDLSEMYKTMAYRAVNMTSALIRIRSELKEFRDEYAYATSVGRDESLEFITNTLHQASDRLVAAKENLERIESRKRKEIYKPVMVTAATTNGKS